jgi:hypothetical protein
VYIQEFNILHKLAASVATLNAQAVLRYFIQKLHTNIRIGTAVATLTTIKITQVVARIMDLILGRQRDVIKGKPMDTFTG